MNYMTDKIEEKPEINEPKEKKIKHIMKNLISYRIIKIIIFIKPIKNLN